MHPLVFSSRPGPAHIVGPRNPSLVRAPSYLNRHSQPESSYRRKSSREPLIICIHRARLILIEDFELRLEVRIRRFCFSNQFLELHRGIASWLTSPRSAAALCRRYDFKRRGEGCVALVAPFVAGARRRSSLCERRVEQRHGRRRPASTALPHRPTVRRAGRAGAPAPPTVPAIRRNTADGYWRRGWGRAATAIRRW